MGQLSKRYLLLLALGLVGKGFALTVSQIPVQGENLYLEGIAYSQSAKSIFVSSTAGGSIIQVKEGKPSTVFLPAGADGKDKAFGMKVDDQLQRLWICSGNTIYIYSLVNKQLLAKISTTSLGQYDNSFLNDLVLDESGNAYITDSFTPNLFFVDSKTLKMSVFASFSIPNYGVYQNIPFNMNGIVMTPDRKGLIVAKTNDGTLWHLSLKDKAVKQIALSEPVYTVDGLVWGSDNRLLIIRNFMNKVSALTYNPRAKVQTVADLSIDPKELMIPTTGTLVKTGDEQTLYLVNSHFEQSAAPYTITKVQFDR